MNRIIGSAKVVLFDHDDTLVGTIKAKWEQHRQVARQYYGIELTDDDLRQHWGKPLQELVCLLYGTSDVEQAMANNYAHHQDFPKELFAATIPTLRHLKKEGKLLGVITATSRMSFEHDLDLHQVPKKLLDYTQTAEDSEYHKPNPKVFDAVIKWLSAQNIKPNKVAYVGDGLHDMQAAVGAGFSFVGVETGLVTAKQFAAAGIQSVPTVGHLLSPSAKIQLK